LELLISSPEVASVLRDPSQSRPHTDVSRAMALDDAGRDAVRPASVMLPAASVLVHDGHDALVKRREMVGDVLSRVTSTQVRTRKRQITTHERRPIPEH